MKKIIIGAFIVLSMSLQGAVPKDVDNQIRDYVKSTYTLDQYGSSVQKMMYDEEIKSYEWLVRNVKSSEDKDTYNRTARTYNPNIYGYSVIKMMYVEEKKNNGW